LLDHTFFAAITSVFPAISESATDSLKRIWWDKQKRQAGFVLLASVFLVSVPVFFQAPLVRLLPWLSLVLTGGWVWLSLKWRSHPQTYIRGDLLLGFSWSWLAGSIYWGWLRWEPAIHIPVEAMALPFALWFIWRGWGLIGNCFYLGSLLGTAITDLYFYITGLIPYWRELMAVEPNLVKPLLQGAVAQVQTPWGISWAIVLANLLLGVGIYALQKGTLHYLAFAGAVLSTIFVDALFLIAAYFGIS
jgi:hypothetical protein